MRAGTVPAPSGPGARHVPDQGERHRRRESVAEVRQTSTLPLLVTPVAPAVEQNAPGVTVGPGAGAAAGVVAGTACGGTVCGGMLAATPLGSCWPTHELRMVALASFSAWVIHSP